MKTLYIILISLILTGCYTKKGCQKLCVVDTVSTTLTIRDTIIVESIKTDTFFSASVDTFTLVKDNLVIKYKKVLDKVYLSGEYKGDTIYKTKQVFVKVPCTKPPKTFWQKVYDKVLNSFAVLGIILLLLFIIKSKIS